MTPERARVAAVTPAVVLATILAILLACGCGGPYTTVLWHKHQPEQGEPEPRTNLLEMAKYAGAAVSPYVAATVAIEKIITGVSADIRTSKGETLLVRVPTPNGGTVAIKSGEDARPEQIIVVPAGGPTPAAIIPSEGELKWLATLVANVTAPAPTKGATAPARALVVAVRPPARSAPRNKEPQP